MGKRIGGGSKPPGGVKGVQKGGEEGPEKRKGVKRVSPKTSMGRNFSEHFGYKLFDTPVHVAETETSKSFNRNAKWLQSNLGSEERKVNSLGSRALVGRKPGIYRGHRVKKRTSYRLLPRTVIHITPPRVTPTKINFQVSFQHGPQLTKRTRSNITSIAQRAVQPSDDDLSG